MGEVWRGFDKRLGRVVALKILRQRWGVSAEKFREEAKLASRLSHPGIAAVHDMEELPDGRPFFSMKLVEGIDLESFLTAQQTDKLNVSECLRIFRQICEAVGYAHELDPPLIHRDLKPQNVMIGRHGEVYVMDWGIARVVTGDRAEVAPESPRHSDESVISSVTPTTDSVGGMESEDPRALTIPGVAKGTAAYMAPEQAKGIPSAICPATDVFCLGGILCRMLTGFSTFESRQQAMDGDVSGALARLPTAKADPGLASIATKCLTPDASGRYVDANEVLNAVARYESDQVERLRNVELAEAKRQIEIVERQRRRRWQYSLGLIAMILTCVAFVSNSRRQASEKQQADQRAELAKDAAAQLTEAKLLYRLATERPLELSGFEMAIKAARQAVSSAKLVGNADAVSSAQALQNEIETEQAEVPKNIQFMTDLAAAQLPPIPRRKGDIATIEAPTYGVISNRYREAFKNRGFDFTFDTNVAEAELILNELPNSILPDIVAHIDQYWFYIAATPEESWPADISQRIQSSVALANALDSDTTVKSYRSEIVQIINGKPIRPIDEKEVNDFLYAPFKDVSTSPPGRLLALASIFRVKNDSVTGTKFLIRAARERPTDLILMAAVAVGCESAKEPNWPRALQYRRAMTSLEPRLALGLAYDLLHDHRHQESFAVIQRLHEIRPASAESYNAMGVCLSFEMNGLGLERQMYLDALKLQPEFEPAQHNLKLVEAELSE